MFRHKTAAKWLPYAITFAVSFACVQIVGNQIIATQNPPDLGVRHLTPWLSASTAGKAPAPDTGRPAGEVAYVLNTGVIERAGKLSLSSSTDLQFINGSLQAGGLNILSETIGLSAKIKKELALLSHRLQQKTRKFTASDSVAIMYQARHDGAPRARNALVGLQFNIANKTHYAFRVARPDTSYNYYTANARPILPLFLAHPIDLQRARISSRFNHRRIHPVSGKTQSHNGVDYAAKIGTPVYAAADGKVSFRGRKGTYGRTLIMNHGNGYKTLYAHLSMFARDIKVDKKVKLGQIIAYVGESGLTTGPHLHYELFIDGVATDPLSLPLPGHAPLTAQERSAFFSETSALITAFDNQTQKYAANALAYRQ